MDLLPKELIVYIKNTYYGTSIYVYLSCIFVGEPLVSEMLAGYPEYIRLNQHQFVNVPKSAHVIIVSYGGGV